MALFLYSKGKEYSYEDLFIAARESLASSRVQVPSNEPFMVFSKLLGCLICGLSCEIIDSDLTDLEIRNLGMSSESLLLGNKNEINLFYSIDEFVQALYEKKIKGSISLFTSGTTGRPKKVSHTITNLLRNIKKSESHIHDVWAFAYNPTHMAGIQVFFQALLNFNPLIDVFTSTEADFKYLSEHYGINRISATPTFYRKIISSTKEPWLNIRSVTCGGEKLDRGLYQALKITFPNARIYNIYASTEAGVLFQAINEIFIIPEYLNGKVMVSDSGEILVHESLIGNSEDLILDNGWYHSGDIVELLAPNKFIFKSRISEMINVGGDKVNPNEIEELISAMEFVYDVRVFGRRNSVTGEIVAAEVVLKNDVDKKKNYIEEIQKRLKQKVQPYKIPQIIKIVDKLNVTNTGKKARK